MELYKKTDYGFAAATRDEVHIALLAFQENTADSLNCVADALPILTKALGKRKTEAFMVLFLDHKNKLIGRKVMSEGIEEQTAVYPRNICRECLKRHATGCIIAHNHPTGRTEPSPADKDMTLIIKRAMDTLDLRLVDHVIIGQGFYSFRENGML